MQVRNMTFRLKLLCFQTTEAEKIATDEELKKKKRMEIQNNKERIGNKAGWNDLTSTLTPEPIS